MFFPRLVVKLRNWQHHANLKKEKHIFDYHEWQPYRKKRKKAEKTNVKIIIINGWHPRYLHAAQDLKGQINRPFLCIWYGIYKQTAYEYTKAPIASILSRVLSINWVFDAEYSFLVIFLIFLVVQDWKFYHHCFLSLNQPVF